MQLITPPRLKPGDVVGIVSPSQSLQDRIDRFHIARKVFEQELGVTTKLGDHALGKHWYHSGTVEERLTDFHTMIADPGIKAVMFSVGGYTAVDLLRDIDYDLIKNNPKIISGISDCTTLLNPIFAKTGLITFHGFEFSFLGYPGRAAYMLESLRRTFTEGGVGEINPNVDWRDWRGEYTAYKGWNTIRAGKATGRLVGGNMTSIMHWVDTEYSVDFDGTLLFIEGYKLNKKTIHAYLSDLKLRGVFDRINGLIVGYFVGSDDLTNDDNKRPIQDVILEVLSEYSFPIMQIGEIGHFVENAILPIGIQASIDTGDLKFSITDMYLQR